MKIGSLFLNWYSYYVAPVEYQKFPMNHRKYKTAVV